MLSSNCTFYPSNVTLSFLEFTCTIYFRGKFLISSFTYHKKSTPLLKGKITKITPYHFDALLFHIKLTSKSTIIYSLCDYICFVGTRQRGNFFRTIREPFSCISKSSLTPSGTCQSKQCRRFAITNSTVIGAVFIPGQDLRPPPNGTIS